MITPVGNLGEFKDGVYRVLGKIKKNLQGMGKPSRVGSTKSKS